ncbi:MAG: integrase arm-type DNA-binding domain-containing protein [Steroidobacteraceae bacterium]
MAGLTDLKIQREKPRERPYKLKDEKGLYLLVQPAGSRLWRLRFSLHGKEGMVSLGSYPEVSLKQARDKRDEARKLIAHGVNPATHRKATRAARADTFGAIAEEWLQLQKAKLAATTYDKARWMLVDLLGPYLGRQPIKALTPADVLEALRRIEARGRIETAHRAKQRAGQVFRYAIVTRRVERDPTADLRGALQPVVSKNRAAITDPARIGELLRALDGYRGQPGTEVALKLAPHLFVRPGELRLAKWEEFTLVGDEPLWRIPGERMKMGEEHLVPLSSQAVALLNDLLPITGPKGYLFPSLRTGARPISENTINAALRRLGYSKEDMTAHGFRAMASTSLNEQGYAPDVIELQLAHAERNKVRAAYNRAQRLAERRKMMQDWSNYLDGLRAGADIVPMKRKA